MLSEDPLMAPPPKLRTPTATPRNSALCEECNKSLSLDDSVIEPCLKTSLQGELFIGRHLHSSSQSYVQYSVFGGINYNREDELPDLPALSHAAENGCEFCTAVKEGLETKYQRTRWWKHHPGALVLRIQYSWTVRRTRTDLNSVVVSVFHPELNGWEKQALQFLIHATEGKLHN